MVQSSTYSGSSTTRDPLDKTRDATSSLSNRMEEAAQSLAEQGREVGESMQYMAENVRGSVEKSVRDQPMTTLLGAVAIGFVIGALWKS